ncbi:sugar isomerase domain-containing protein [Sporosarcina beigongshangi]|uniref:sugar isomerase domain-containing protein n=1 Tax=Sporosarcina beigongshangi TaxID=2782538 RepID=UPI00193AD62E|nr:SIS domain-containing protein [Sporosarcina beigongshangi]
MNPYFEAINTLMQEVSNEEQPTIEKVAVEIAKRLARGGIIQLFGCGHSHLIAEESYFRAGGLVPVQPIFIESLMLHKGATKASAHEKDATFIQTFEDQLDFRQDDTVIVISTSGRNPVPIDVANKARQSGAYTVSIQSLYYEAAVQPSRHPSGKRLEDVVDDQLNTHVPLGDGLLTSGELLYAPASSIMANLLLHAAFNRVMEIMIADGLEPPVFKSSNIDGSTAHNERMIERYSNRIHF